MNDLDHLLHQLDRLIGFLDVSSPEIYAQIKNHDRFELGVTIDELYERKYENFANHVITSALLLGFAHFEDFITKCVVRYLIAFPDKNEYKVSLKMIREEGNALISTVATLQAGRLTFSDKVKLIQKNFPSIRNSALQDVRFANSLRNCLMHNNGIADERLKPRFGVGEAIVLTSGEVHGYGLQARHVAAEVWSQIEQL